MGLLGFAGLDCNQPGTAWNRAKVAAGTASKEPRRVAGLPAHGRLSAGLAELRLGYGRRSRSVPNLRRARRNALVGFEETEGEPARSAEPEVAWRGGRALQGGLADLPTDQRVVLELGYAAAAFKSSGLAQPFARLMTSVYMLEPASLATPTSCPGGGVTPSPCAPELAGIGRESPFRGLTNSLSVAPLQAIR